VAGGGVEFNSYIYKLKKNKKIDSFHIADLRKPRHGRHTRHTSQFILYIFIYLIKNRSNIDVKYKCINKFIFTIGGGVGGDLSFCGDHVFLSLFFSHFVNAIIFNIKLISNYIIYINVRK
jgi:hypothetical protein